MPRAPGTLHGRLRRLSSAAGAALAAIVVTTIAARGAAPALRARPTNGGAAAFPVTVRDDAGRTVRVPAAPRRIVSLSPAHTETLFALGLGERVVGVDHYSDHPPAARQKPRLNCWPRPPLERLVELRPELVVVFTEDAEFLASMAELGIPAVKLFPTGYRDALRGIRLLGRITGREAAGAAVAAAVEQRVQRVRRRVAGRPPVSVLFEMDASDPARPFVAGSAGLYGSLLELAGGRNVFGDLRTAAAQVSAEQVVARSPEVILLGDTLSPLQPQSVATVRARPGWESIRAVRSGRIHAVNSDLVTRPGPRIAEGLERIAALLHPAAVPAGRKP